MTKRTPPWLDDMSQWARRAGRLAMAARAESERGWKAAVMELLEELPLVQREELEIVRALVQATQAKQAELEKRIAALEKGRAPPAKRASPAQRAKKPR